jgi:CheY-like chemotaxis protein
MIKKIKCFLIDDDADEHEFFQDALQELDSDVVLFSAKSAPEGLQKLKEQGDALPDFIFLDLNMPGMTGKDCLSILKHDKKLCKIPVVIYSTSSALSDREDALSHGAYRYMVKPSSITILIKQLQSFFQSH